MKKKLLFAGLMGALTLVSCVDTKESDSVANVRNAKSELLKAQAQAEVIEANANATKAAAEAAYANAQAAYQQAEAARVKAETELVAAQKALLDAQVEAQKIANELAKAQGDIALQKAKAEADAAVAQAQAAMAAAEAAKKQAEAAMKQAEDNLEKAALQQQIDLANLQKQLLQAQKNLDQLEAQLKEQDIQQYKLYAGMYYAALSQVYDLESEIAAKKLEIAKMQLKGTDNDLYWSAQNTSVAIANYNRDIEYYNKQITQYEADLAVAKAKLEKVKSCESCVSGDVNALKIEIFEKQHNLDHMVAAWGEKNNKQYDDLYEALQKAQYDLYGLTTAGQEKIEAVNEADNAIWADPLVKLNRNLEIVVKDKEDNDRSFYAGNWAEIFNYDYACFYKTEAEPYELCDTVASYERENDYGDKEVVAKTVYSGTFWIPAPSYSEYMSADARRLEIEKKKAQYVNAQKEQSDRANIWALNAAAYNARAAQLEAGMNLDSVKVDGKNFCDSIIQVLHTNYDLGIDTITYVKAKPGDWVPRYSYNELFDYVVENMYQNALYCEMNATNSVSNADRNALEAAAFDKLLDMVDNLETYQEALKAKLDAYHAANIAREEGYLKAESAVEEYEYVLQKTDEDYVAIAALREELNALNVALADLMNGNSAIESLEWNVQYYENEIADYKQYIQDTEQYIKNAETTGKVNELDIKQGFENLVAALENEVKLLESMKDQQQSVANVYKAIADSFVETAE